VALPASLWLVSQSDPTPAFLIDTALVLIFLSTSSTCRIWGSHPLPSIASSEIFVANMLRQMQVASIPGIK
jgi:hypothetical protein